MSESAEINERNPENESEVFDSLAEAYDTFQSRLADMAEELADIESTHEDKEKTLQDFFDVIDAYAVQMKLPSGKIISGLPLTIEDSNIPKDQWDGWGRDSSKVSSGALRNLKTSLSGAIHQPNFNAREVLGSYYPAAVEETLDRLFGEKES